MNQKQRFATFLLIACSLLSCCNRAVTDTNTPTPRTATETATLTPGTDADNIVDLVEQGAITFRITSGAINELGLEIHNTTDQQLNIDIPSGTYFVNIDPTSQNMVVLQLARVAIQPKGRADIQLQVACANLHLTEPTRENTFTIRRTPHAPMLSEIIDKLNSAEVDFPVEQAAIWIITDDATFDELGLLVKDSRFGTSIINADDAVSAMMLIDEAGLSIHGYSIWEDLTQFLGKVTDPDLKTWLYTQFSIQVMERATRVVEETTHTAETAQVSEEATKTSQEGTPIPVEGTRTTQANPTSDGAEFGQYAIMAKASSQYSSSRWSEKQAIGAPNTATCGDIETAWVSSSSSGKDWLLLTYDQPVIPTRIVIFETFNPGAVSLVEVLDENNNPTKVYEAAPTRISQCPHKLVIDGIDVDMPVSSVRVTIDHEIWSEIDAVQLFGIPE